MIHMSGFRWLTPGLKLKRWLVLFGLGMLLVIVGVALMLNYEWLSYFEDLFCSLSMKRQVLIIIRP